MKNARVPQVHPSWLPSRQANIAEWSRQYARLHPRPGSAARGYDKDWFRLRAEVLRDEPYCRACAAQGIEHRATMVDHIFSIRAAPERRLDKTNLMPLCNPCHRIKSARVDHSFGQGRR